MKTVGAFEAKTHFSQLLVNVINGETVVITKHGQKVALLVPIEGYHSKKSTVAQAIGTIRSLRKGVTLGKGLSIKAMKEEGRK